MFVVCAQAPGRIDGVLVVLVVEVLITSHSACPLMRAAHKELAQLMSSSTNRGLDGV